MDGSSGGSDKWLFGMDLKGEKMAITYESMWGRILHSIQQLTGSDYRSSEQGMNQLENIFLYY